MGIDLNRMAVFVAVVEHRSFTAAARALGMTKSTVSQHVRQLETSIGVTLMQRTTRSMSLTEAGQLYYDTASRILREAEHMHSQLQHIKRAPSGVLRVTAPLDFAACALIPLATEFMRRYPRVEVDLVAEGQILDMVERRLDLSIRVGWLGDSSHHATTLGAFDQVACASPAYLARVRPPETPADLAGLEWVSLSALSSPRRWTFRDEHGGEQTVQMSGRAVANDGTAVRAFLLAGAGVSVLPDYQVKDDLHAERLVRVLPAYTLPKGGIFAVVPSRRNAPAKVSEFTRFLKAELGEHARR
jgi:DNA-binding transcriptional LysR family regulator